MGIDDDLCDMWLPPGDFRVVSAVADWYVGIEQIYFSLTSSACACNYRTTTAGVVQ